MNGVAIKSLARRHLPFATLSLLTGCAGQQVGGQAKEANLDRRDTEIRLEECAVDSESVERLDADGDGRPEIVRVMDGAKEVCRTLDLNLDGRVDRTVFYAESGDIRRVESDFDREGVVDEIAIYEAGRLKEKHRATNLDGKLDTWDFFKNDELIRSERDGDGDGVIDQWWEYPHRGCPLIHLDRDRDGRPDPGASIDYCRATGDLPASISEPMAPPVQASSAEEETPLSTKESEASSSGASTVNE